MGLAVLSDSPEMRMLRRGVVAKREGEAAEAEEEFCRRGGLLSCGPTPCPVASEDACTRVSVACNSKNQRKERRGELP
jgi:hypothetical protein